MDEETSAEVIKPSKKKMVLTTLLGVVCVMAAGGGTYYWQHNKLKDVNHQVATVKSQNANLNKSIASLNKKDASLQNQYNQAKATIDSYQAKTSQSSVIVTQADLSMTVNGAQYVNPDGTVTQGGKWFGVNVTLTNNTSSTISIADNDFYLKDLQGNEYPELTTQGASTLPSGWVSLPNTTLAPGQKLTGTVTFQMPSDTIKSFDFINVSKTYPVDSSN